MKQRGGSCGENAQKLLSKPAVTICPSTSPDSNLPVWVAFHHCHVPGLGPLDLLTLHWWQWGLRRKWWETPVLPPAELPVIRSWIKNSLHHQMRRTLQDRKEQTEEKCRGARPRHSEKPGPPETQAAPEQSRPAWIRPCHVLDCPESSPKCSQRNLWKNPNEFLILVTWPKISPFSSWSSSFFQTYLHGGWGPNGAKKAPKCPDIEQWRPPSFFAKLTFL